MARQKADQRGKSKAVTMTEEERQAKVDAHMAAHPEKRAKPRVTKPLPGEIVNASAPVSDAERAAEAAPAWWQIDAAQVRRMEAVATESAQKPYGEYYKRFIAAEVATRRRGKDHPEAVAVRKLMGESAFDALGHEILGIRKRCGILNEKKPELAELVAMIGLFNGDFTRRHKAALEGLRDALKAAVDASTTVDDCCGRNDPGVQTRAIGEQLFSVQMELSVFPAKERKRPRLAAKEEAARMVRAKRVGEQLAICGIDREPAAKYLIARGHEKKGAILTQAMENQRKREKGELVQEMWRLQRLQEMSVESLIANNPER